ncbi:MAG TPA: phenylalanine--tRNA ligase subunit beta [Candidatus Saccharimonadales bacterium]|jgi:phenylalanyl-tRNA synthetase beta chain|nr:phenylalanine--tRNA ligase subunit beta [Candidatus Saccharimonadales bacterium]
MKVSLNTIKGLIEKYHSSADVTAIGVDKLIEKIGAQLGGVDEVIELGKKYEGIVVVKVASCEKHPDADKLSLCLVDDGGVVKEVKRNADGYVQIVCGAPNVRAGLLAAWIPPGKVVPATADKDPFVLEAREIRGQVSNGMLASPKELALGDSHDGILEVEADVRPGTPFDEVFGLKDEIVIDIENKMFTHRPDCFGFLGIARELAGIQGMPYKSPDWYQSNPTFPAVEAAELPLKILNELPESVPRFTAIVMSNIQVGPSPIWLQVFLAEMGQKSINNIVDYTNFYMLETGQPLHAYDYDKVKALSGGEANIVIRNPKPGEKIKLLNGKEIEPRAEAIMIATDKQLIGIGGIMGGSETEVDESTKNIILECANFDMYSVRRTSMEYGLFTDAVTRFTKGQSPLQNLAVLAKIVDEIKQHANGKVASPVIDDNHVDQTVLTRDSLYPPVKLSVGFVNERLGLQLKVDEMKRILENVEFQVDVKGDDLTVTAPFWRTDIELREDVVEEIGRLYGYDHLPLELSKRDLTPVQKDRLLTIKAQIRDKLSTAGANEVLTYSFVHGDLLKKVGQDPAKAFQIANALSPDLQYYRISLMPSLLDKVHPNIKAGYDEFALFEIGKGHIVGQVDDDGLPREDELTALVVAAADKLNKPGSAFYQAKQFLQNLAKTELIYKPVPEIMQAYDITKPYDMNRAAFVYVGELFLGIIGEFKPSVARALKLPKYCAGFEVDTSVLQKVVSRTQYVPLPNFPKVIQDITLKVPASVTYQELFDTIQNSIDKLKPSNTWVKLEPVDIYQKEETHKNITLRLQIASYERTLTDAEVNKLLDAVAAAAKDQLKAERI